MHFTLLLLPLAAASPIIRRQQTLIPRAPLAAPAGSIHSPGYTILASTFSLSQRCHPSTAIAKKRAIEPLIASVCAEFNTRNIPVDASSTILREDETGKVVIFTMRVMKESKRAREQCVAAMQEIIWEKASGCELVDPVGGMETRGGEMVLSEKGEGEDGEVLVVFEMDPEV